MRHFPSCPSCKSKQIDLEVYECRVGIGGCGRLFCRQCAGGLTTVRCPGCREPVFIGPVVQVGAVQPAEPGK